VLCESLEAGHDSLSHLGRSRGFRFGHAQLGGGILHRFFKVSLCILKHPGCDFKKVQVIRWPYDFSLSLGGLVIIISENIHGIARQGTSG